MIVRTKQTTLLSLVVLTLFGFAGQVYGAVQGIEGSFDGTTRTFDLTAEAFHISTPDGARILVWGYGETGGLPQYPGPTLLINQGDDVVINLSNRLDEATSIMFPGHDVDAAGDVQGIVTEEANATIGTAAYSFTATEPGTYMYHSASRQSLQIEMGLLGAIVVRPSSGADQAYNHAGTAFDLEHLFILSEMDPAIHQLVEFGLLGFPGLVDDTEHQPTLWFINGRNAPDTMAPDATALLPNQPYGALARVHPGDTLLLRVVSAGRDSHPFHTHGNHFRQIARDGRMTTSGEPGAGPDVGAEDFTLQAAAGATYDALFSWTGEQLGWDIYGTVDEGGTAHDCNVAPGTDFDAVSHEYCPDHGRPLPVILPELQDLTFGGFYSGSPFLGASGDLPPGEGGLNINNGLFFMWHSHNALEQVNNDVPPGGMATMLIIEPPDVTIP
jgi:hypothetical protein